MSQTIASIQRDDPRARTWNTDVDTDKPVDLVARISRIEQAHTAPRERGKALLDALCEGLGAVAGVITFSLGAEEFELQTEDGPKGAGAWIPSLRSAALESRSHAHSIARVFGSGTDAPEFVVIAAPFDLAGRDPFGAVALLCRCSHASQAERLQLHLRSVSLLASSLLSRSAARRPAVDMDDFARVLSKVGQYKSVEQFAYAMTNAAKQRFGCEQTALGMVWRGKLKVACISGLDQINHRTPGVHLIEQAMGECADAREPIIEQNVDRWDSGEVAADGMLHKRWRAACTGASVASVPVMAGDELVAILSLRRTFDEPFDADEIAAIQKLLAPLGSAIPLIASATRSLPAHAVHSTKRSADWLFRPRSITKKLLISGAIAGAMWYALMPAMYRVTTPGTVIAEREYVVAATFGGRISEVRVREGERVKAGDLMIELDTTRLQTEAAVQRSEIARAEIRMKEAIATSDPAGAAVARAELDVHFARLEDIHDRIDDASIRAPRDGIVTGDDISNLQGRVVAEGEPLLAIADDSRLALELRLPQSRITDVAPGSSLRFASHARPEDPGVSTLTHIASSGAEHEGRTIFLAKSPLPEGQDWLRPGMEGVAIIDAGMHPNWWIGLHRVIDAARLRFWID